nr:MAG TPA_asm: hypothetical protein [Caudoviricetes sp.]
MLNASHIGSGGEVIRCHGGDGDLTDLASRPPPPKHLMFCASDTIIN